MPPGRPCTAPPPATASTSANSWWRAAPPSSPPPSATSRRPRTSARRWRRATSSAPSFYMVGEWARALGCRSWATLGTGHAAAWAKRSPKCTLGEAQSVSWERGSPRPLGLSLKTCYILMVRIPCQVAQNKVFPFLPGVLWAEEGDREPGCPGHTVAQSEVLRVVSRMVSCPHPVGPMGEGHTPLL